MEENAILVSMIIVIYIKAKNSFGFFKTFINIIVYPRRRYIDANCRVNAIKVKSAVSLDCTFFRFVDEELMYSLY